MKAKNNFRAIVMKNAWTIFRKSGDFWAVCMRKAWEIYRLRMKMLQGTARFWYRKMDGTVRMAVGTLQGLSQRSPRKNREMVTAMCYWDTESQGYRSFRLEKFILMETSL